jgi:hypothetical protein
MSREISLVFYPGHLGPIGPDGPTSELRTAGRGIRWDRAVKVVLDPDDASDLVLHGGFYRCLWIEEAVDHYSLTKKRIQELIKGGDLTTAEYDPAAGAAWERETLAAASGKPITVLVLDQKTRARIRQEVQAADAKTAAGAAQKGED